MPAFPPILMCLRVCVCGSTPQRCNALHVLLTQAALQLGLRATRRPAGYWDSLEVLDLELDALIAGLAETSCFLLHVCCCAQLAVG